MFDIRVLFTVCAHFLFIIDHTNAGKNRREAARIEACSRDPSLFFCQEFRVSPPQDRGDNDKKACSSLEREYRESCDSRLARRRDEFCAAYDNENDPNGSDADQQTESSENNDQSNKNRRVDGDSPSPKDYIEFCKNYKQRFLYVCPDPVRFGERAAVFCPIYSERCQIPLPERPVLPAAMTNNNGMSPVRRLCGQFRNFANSYCGNPFTLQYPNVRENCDKYQRVCNNNPNTVRQPIMMG